MAKNRQVAVLFLLAILVLSAAPTFVFAVENDEDQTEDNSSSPAINKHIAIRTRMMFKVANRTAIRIEHFIEMIYANESLKQTLENDGLLDDLEGNVTLFVDARNLLEEASIAIEAGNYEDALANITQSMKIFREVYRAICRITEKPMAPMRNRVIARGLLVAMQRALERIERIRMLVPEDAENITSLLDQAEQYLNITAAEEMLAEGNVTGVSHNLVKANLLINKACLLLREGARTRIWMRVKNYLKGIEKAVQRVSMKIAFAKMRGINVSAVLEEMGYQNETQFRESILDMIMSARGKAGDIKDALLELHKISQTFWRMDRALTRHIHQHHGLGGEHGQNQNQTQSKSGSSGAGLGKGNSTSSQKGSNNRRGRP